MSQPQVLVVCASRNMKRHIYRALGSAGFTVWDAPFERQAVAEGLARKPAMCIVDVDDGNGELGWLVDLLHNDYPDVIPLLLSQDHEMPFVRESLTSGNLNNLIAKHGGVSAVPEVIDEGELIVTCQKLCKNDIFGMEKYLTTWGNQIHEIPIVSNASKGEILEELEQFLRNIDTYAAVRNSVLLVADELIMNAIYNAPRDAEGNAKYVGRDRSLPLQLAPEEHATFRYACDGRNVAISVTDRFGSLDRDVIMRYLRRCFSGEAAEVEEKIGGAGLGLHMVFNSITQLTFNIEAGVSTEVIAVFYIRSGSLAFKSAARSLNIFYSH